MMRFGVSFAMKKNRKKTVASTRRCTWPADVLLVLLLCLANAVWFLPLREMGIITGDDIGFVLDARRIASVSDLFAVSGIKYRPVVRVLQAAEVWLCGNDYTAFFLVNLCFQCLVTGVLYWLALRISRRRSIAFFIAGLFIVCPFSYYSIMQVHGIMEAACIFFLLFTIFFGLRFFRTGKAVQLLLSCLFAAFTVFTHERFLALAPVFVIAVLLCGRIGWKKKIPLAVMSLVPFAANMAVKRLVGVSVMEGTGGESISLSVGTVAGFVGRGLMAVLGINNGPSYLNGYTYDQYSLAEQRSAWVMFGIAVLALLLCLLRLALEDKPRRKAYGFKCVLLAVLTIGALLLAGSVTIRLEMRWLLAPYVVVLLLLAYCFRKINWAHFGELALIALTGLSIFINIHYRAEIGQVYFTQVMKRAQAVYELTIGRYGEALADYELCFVADDETAWTFGEPGNSMFDVYLERPVSFTYATPADSVEPSEKVKVFKITENAGIEEISHVEGYGLVYDMNAAPEAHVVFPDTEAETPSGKGIFFMKGNLTVLSGYRDHVDGLNIPEHSVIRLSAHLPFDEGDGARVTVFLTVDGKMTSMNWFDIYPGQDVMNQVFEIGDALKNASLWVAVTSPTGDAENDWVVFPDFRVLEKTGD